MSVHLNIETGSLGISDLGVTMRVLLSVAAKGQGLCGKRTWDVTYKGARIGQVRVKAPKIERKEDDSNGTSA